MSWTTALGTLTTNQRLAGRFYIRISALPTGTHTFVRFLNSSTTLAGIQMSTTGTLRAVGSGAAAVGTAGTFTMATNTWYRVEFDFTGIGGGATAGGATIRIFLGDGTTAQGTDATASGVDFAALAPTIYRNGYQGSTGLPASASTWLDDLVLNSTGMPGPAVAAAEIPNLIMAPMR